MNTTLEMPAQAKAPARARALIAPNPPPMSEQQHADLLRINHLQVQDCHETATPLIEKYRREYHAA